MSNAYAQPPTIGFIKNLNQGDRGCYVDLINSQGEITTQIAEFSICEQDLIAKPVFLLYETAKVQSVKCQGNPECSLTDTVSLITNAIVLEPSPKELEWESYWNECGKKFMSREDFTNSWRPVFEMEWNKKRQRPNACG